MGRIQNPFLLKRTVWLGQRLSWMSFQYFLIYFFQINSHGLNLNWTSNLNQACDIRNDSAASIDWRFVELVYVLDVKEADFCGLCAPGCIDGTLTCPPPPLALCFHVVKPLFTCPRLSHQQKHSHTCSTKFHELCSSASLLNFTFIILSLSSRRQQPPKVKKKVLQIWSKSIAWNSSGTFTPPCCTLLMSFSYWGDLDLTWSGVCTHNMI